MSDIQIILSRKVTFVPLVLPQSFRCRVPALRPTIVKEIIQSWPREEGVK
jgi:hypothetical protein